MIVNAGALTHYSWSLHDALAAFDGIVVELHLSNPAAREPWRHTSVVAARRPRDHRRLRRSRVPPGGRGRGPPARRPGGGRVSRDAPLPPLEVADRLARLRAGIDAAGVDALLVTALANVRYLTGFTGSAGVLLVTGGTAVLVTDGRYRTQAAEQLAAAGLDDGIELGVGGIALQRQALAGAGADRGGAASRARGRSRDLVRQETLGRGPGARAAGGHERCGRGAAPGQGPR